MPWPRRAARSRAAPARSPSRCAYRRRQRGRKAQGTTRRRRRLLAAGITTLAAVAVASAVAAWAFNREQVEANLQKDRAVAERAEAQREGARAALLRGDRLEARAKLRGSIETQDSPLARALWWQLDEDPLIWRQDLLGLAQDIAASPDGKSFVVGCLFDRSIYIFDLRTRAVRILRGQDDWISAVAYSPDGKLLASGGQERAGPGAVGSGHRRLADPARPHQGRVAPGLQPRREAARLGELGQDAAHLGRRVRGAGARDRRSHARGLGRGLLPRWPARGLGELRQDRARLGSGHRRAKLVRFPATPPRSTTWKYSPDGKLLASAGSSDNTVRIWDAATGAEVRVITGAATGRINDVNFSPDGKFVASGSADQDLARVWEVATGKLVQALAGHDGLVSNVAFSMDGKAAHQRRLHQQDHVRVWDLDSANAAARQEANVGHVGGANDVTFSPDGKLVASGGADDTIRLWDVAGGKELKVLRGHTGQVATLRFTPDGKSLVSGGSDATVRVWDVKSGIEAKVLTGHTHQIADVAVSPDGSLIASASWDGTVRLHGTCPPAPRPPCCAASYTHRVSCVAFSPDGKRLVSGSFDGTLRTWDVATHAAEKTYTGHTAEVYGCDVNPDGTRLTSVATVRHRAGLETGHREQGGKIVGKIQGPKYPTFDPIAWNADGKTIGVARARTARRGSSAPTARGAGGGLRPPGRRRVVGFRFQRADGKLYARPTWTARCASGDVATRRPRWIAPAQVLDGTGLAAGVGTSWRKELDGNARAASVSGEGQILCLRADDDTVETWDLRADRLISRTPAPGLVGLIAYPGRLPDLGAQRGCAR